ncbi:MAG: radical SAM protein, partial [Spirochaetaceae bacterium]|nr:radical SAM protein [Spirochaetaceae bacterium]
IIENLDNLPSPWKASALKGRKYEDTVWELTRGCPFNCHFCFESKGSDRVRHKSLSQAAVELKQLQKRGTGNIFLLDPTFNASPNRAKELLRLFISQAPELRYHMEVRTEFLDEEQAELYSELGCTLQIGLQTAHSEVARNIGRPFSPEGFQEKLLPLHEYAVPYGLDLIYGLPGDNLEGFRESLDFALSCAPNHLDIFPLSVLPGTRLRETARGLGLEYLKSAPYTVTGRKNKNHSFSPEDLSLAANLTTAVDELYNKGRAVPWFLLCTDVLKLRPVEIIEAFIRDTEELNPIEELEKPSRLRDFIQRLVRDSNQSDFAPLLGDIICLFTLDSACREGLTLPSAITFTFNPQALNEHLEMGISDLEELSAFVPRQAGNYLPSVEENILVFKYESGNNSV